MSTETEQTLPTLRAGDVVRYIPDNTWCRDGYAIARPNSRDDLVLEDTYWSSGGHLVTAEFEVLFNLADYEEKPQSTWETFAPADRQRIPRHHGHQTVYLVRKGAAPDLATQIENAELSLASAEDALRSAQWRVERRREDLAALRAQSEGGTDR